MSICRESESSDNSSLARSAKLCGVARESRNSRAISIFSIAELQSNNSTANNALTFASIWINVYTYITSVFHSRLIDCGRVRVCVCVYVPKKSVSRKKSVRINCDTCLSRVSHSSLVYIFSMKRPKNPASVTTPHNKKLTK